MYQIFTVYLDYKNLEYLTMTKISNRGQVPRAQKLARYDFKILYQLGNKNGKLGASSKSLKYHPKQGDIVEDNKKYPITIVL
jgi:hypothetical protein